MEPVSDRYDFDDINIIRFFGTDVIDLTQVIVSGRENVVILQKLYGPTTILVQLIFPLNLNISAIYSSVTFFDEDEYDLRYESLTLQGAEYEHAHRTVKLIPQCGSWTSGGTSQMKKQYLFLILIYSVVVLVGVTLVVMDSFNLNFSLVFRQSVSGLPFPF